MNRQKGFLLIEVLITLAVLSFGIAAIAASIHRSVKVMKEGSNYFAAARELENKLFELRTPGEVSEGGSGEFTCSVEKTPVPGLPFDRARITVRWQEKGVEKELGVTTLADKKP